MGPSIGGFVLIHNFSSFSFLFFASFSCLFCVCVCVYVYVCGFYSAHGPSICCPSCWVIATLSNLLLCGSWISNRGDDLNDKIDTYNCMCV